VLARAGKHDSARTTIRKLESRSYVPAEGVAAIYAVLGDRAAALTWLERAVAVRGLGLVFLEAEPMYESLRAEPPYRRIVQQLKLVSPGQFPRVRLTSRAKFATLRVTIELTS